MTGKAYAFKEGIGPDLATGQSQSANNQGELATFNTPAEVAAAIAAAVAAVTAAYTAAIAASLVAHPRRFTTYLGGVWNSTFTTATYTTSIASWQNAATAGPRVYPVISARRLKIVRVTQLATAGTPCNSTATYAILKNGVSLGTIAFAASEVGTKSLAIDVAFADGDNWTNTLALVADGAPAGSTTASVALDWDVD